MGIWKAVLMFAMVAGAPQGAFPQGAYIETENVRRPILPWSQGVSLPPAQGEASASSRPSYYWAAFASALDDSTQARVSALGVEVLGFAGRPGPYLLYKIRIRPDPVPVLESLKTLDAFVNLYPVLPEEKVTRKVLQGRFRTKLADGRVKATVFFHRPVGLLEADGLLAGLVDSLQAGPGGTGGIHVIASSDRVLALADLDEVARVEDFMEPQPLKGGR